MSAYAHDLRLLAVKVLDRVAEASEPADEYSDPVDARQWLADIACLHAVLHPTDVLHP